MKLLPILLLVASTAACATDWALVRAPGEAEALQLHRTSVARSGDKALIWVRTLRGDPVAAPSASQRVRVSIARLEVDCRQPADTVHGVAEMSDDDEQPTAQFHGGPLTSSEIVAPALRERLIALACNTGG